jgi:CheY-like chemotaxis protein
MDKKNTRILVVDDSPTVRRLVELILTPQGYIVHTANDGDQGLALAKQICPAVILVDFVMPKMNGYIFCKTLRADPDFKNIPLILITSKGEDVGQKFENDFGVLEYFTKPFEPDELIQKLEEVLSAHKAREQETAPDQGPGSAVDSEGLLAEFHERFDKTVRQYFQKNFPLLMKKVFSDTLREAGLVKHETLAMSGQINQIPLPDLLNFSYNSKLSGRLTIFSREIFGEIFLDKGMFVFATVSHKDRSNRFLMDLLCNDGKIAKASIQKVVEEAREENLPVGRVLVKKGILSEEGLMSYLLKYSQDAFNRILEAQEGSFYLENDSLPLNLQDISFRVPLISVLMDGLRQLDEKQLAATEFTDENIVLVRLITNENALDSVTLNENEMRLFTIIDGQKNLREVIQESPFDPLETKRIFYVLRKAGLLRPKNI